MQVPGDLDRDLRTSRHSACHTSLRDRAARFAVLAGNFIDAPTARALGFITPSGRSLRGFRYHPLVASSSKPDDKYPGRPQTRATCIKNVQGFSDTNMGAILSGEVHKGFDPEDKNVSRQLKSDFQGSPRCS